MNVDNSIVILYYSYSECLDYFISQASPQVLRLFIFIHLSINKASSSAYEQSQKSILTPKIT